MSGQQALPVGPPTRGVDHPLDDVEDWWRAQRNAEVTIGDAIRRSFDEVMDGQRTGRFKYELLRNSEKTYLGTKVEILLRDAFDLPYGSGPRKLDYTIAGHQVDCKYTQDTSWMIPVEAVGELCLLVTASDVTAKFSFGLLRCSDDLLGAENRDRKRQIKAAGRLQIRWLWRNADMPINLLRNLPDPDVQAIFATPGKGNGQTRINELFRRVHRQIVRREVTLTVAQQNDGMKRARDARIHLQPEGIIILGHQKQHPGIARALGLPVPRKGEFIATRLVTATPQRQRQHRPSAVIDGVTWMEAEPSDPAEAGPQLY
jgi:hypothetical protein